MYVYIYIYIYAYCQLSVLLNPVRLGGLVRDVRDTDNKPTQNYVRDVHNLLSTHDRETAW